MQSGQIMYEGCEWGGNQSSFLYWSLFVMLIRISIAWNIPQAGNVQHIWHLVVTVIQSSLFNTRECNNCECYMSSRGREERLTQERKWGRKGRTPHHCWWAGKKSRTLSIVLNDTCRTPSQLKYLGELLLLSDDVPLICFLPAEHFLILQENDSPPFSQCS